MKWKPLFFCFAAILLLLGSFLWPPTFTLWQSFDTAIFKFLNQSLEGHPWAQLFWATVNHKKADLVEDGVFLLFFILAIRAAPKEKRMRKAAEFIFCILLAASLIYFVNRIFLRSHILIPRESPSLVVTECIRLSQEIPWMVIKDETVTCFPGDHATTLLLFTVLYTFYAGKKLGIAASLYALFRILPRLIVGAHWASDVIVGSGCLALFFLSLVLCTPFHLWCIDKIEKIVTVKSYESQKDSL
ncbi:MAG TPA: phosphatase PAP2 family protein [Rhabdochlamydiaceae bacterium]|nr:phosphatase PAP2 family protein [Rhabdochlamydiaceae bacterium]